MSIENAARRTFLAVAAMAAAGAAACMERVGVTRPSSRRRGVTGLALETALGLEDLTPAQHTTLSALDEGFQHALEEKRAFRQEMRRPVAQLLRQEPRVALEDAEMERVMGRAKLVLSQYLDTNVDTMAEVHAALEPAQRSEVAGIVAQRIAEKHRRRAERHAAREEAVAGGRAEGEHVGDRPRRGKLRHIAERLVLTDEQITAFRSIKEDVMARVGGKLRPRGEELDGLLASFATESFAAELTAFRAERVRRLDSMAAEVPHALVTAAELLDESQRLHLSDVVEAGLPA